MRMIEKRISCGCCLAVVVSLMALGHARGEEEDVLPGTGARSQLLGTVQAENFVKQQGSSGVADVASAVGGKVLGYEFGRHPGHMAEFRISASAAAVPGRLWFRTARHYRAAATWDLFWDGRRLAGPASFPTTNSWFVYDWTSISLPEITKGPHTLKIVARHEDANVNFDMIAISAEGMRPPNDLDSLMPPDLHSLGRRFASLTKAVEHLTGRFPKQFDVESKLRSQLAQLQGQIASTPENTDSAELRRLALALELLSHRALVEDNPLLDFPALVFTKRHPLGGQHYAYTEALSWNRDRPRFFKPGAALCTLSPPRPGGKLSVLLDSPDGVVRDPDVHFDGDKILVSHKRNLDEDDYHLYEFDVTSGKSRQLTDDAGFADYEGCYLPDGNIMFSSTRCVQTVDCFPVPTSNLYLADGDGRLVRRVTVNHVHDNFPSVLNDGRVVFTRWEYNDRWVLHVQGLAVMNPDGTATAAYYGNNSFWPISMLHTRAIPGSTKVVCTLSGHHDVDQCGEIGIFDVGRGGEEAAGCVHLWPPRKIEPIRDEFYWRNLSALYQYPYPLSENFFLVSCKPRGKEHFGIYLIDTFGNRELIYEDASISCNSPMPLTQRHRPPAIASGVRYGESEGTVYLADVYRGPGLKGVRRGEVKALRIVEMINRPTGTRHWAGMDGTPPMGLNSSWDAKRVVGTVPVGDDGSALFTVPAEKAIYFQPLDSDGRALQWMRSWVTMQPGEVRACVGCHDKNTVSPRTSLEALVHAPLKPDPAWNATDRPFNFHQDVQPMLDQACARCHDHEDPGRLDLRGDKTDAFSMGYENLRPYVKVAGTRQDPPAIPPRSVGAIASPLIKLLDKGHYDVSLTPEQMNRLVTWIDLGALYYGSYAITDDDAPFGRCVVKQDKPLWDALGDACARCHHPSSPPNLPEQGFGRKRHGRGFQWRTMGSYDTSNAVLINLTHPEQSRLLRAPLSSAAGGLARCSEMIFTDKQDPRYTAALHVIQGWAEDLRRNPREDMPGSQPSAQYQLWWKKRQESLHIERQSREALARQQRQRQATPYRNE
ncbi:MAG: hypothetical protein QF918_10025 [Pirellulaceae bacterium]|jgi:hypothetical protein|nr:hypothetical protein [Pirellulaceae bacterium]MDP6557026.1 hypothetical protein [Pirellulaceae bacterium]